MGWLVIGQGTAFGAPEDSTAAVSQKLDEAILSLQNILQASAEKAAATAASSPEMSFESAVAEETRVKTGEVRFEADGWMDSYEGVLESPDRSRGSDLGQKSGEGWKLSLRDCTEIVLKANPNIQVAYADLKISENAVIQEDAEFDPVLTGSADLNRTRTPSAATGLTAANESAAFEVGVSQKLFTGATIEGAATHTRSGLENRTYGSSLSVAARQPLFKDRGPEITYAPLKISMINQEIAYWDLKTQVMTKLAEVQLAYWDVVERQEVLRARRFSYDQAMELVERSRKAISLGQRTYVDVVEAQATAASREVAVVEAQAALEEKMDRLKRTLSLSGAPFWDQNLLIQEELRPDFKPAAVEKNEMLQLGFQNRPDYRTALSRIQSSEETLLIAENELLPDMDVVMGYETSAAGRTGESMGRLFAGNPPGWSVGMEVTVPWGYRSQIAEKEQARYAVGKRKLSLEDLKLLITESIRGVVRRVHVSLEKITVAETAYDLQLKKLEAAKRKFELGVGTSFEFLSYQEDVSNAQVERVVAITDYHRSLIRLWYETGLTLEKNNIAFPEPLLSLPAGR